MSDRLDKSIRTYKDLLSQIESLKKQIVDEATMVGKKFNPDTGNLMDVNVEDSIYILELYLSLGSSTSDYFGLLHGFEPLTFYNNSSLYQLFNNISKNSWLNFINDIIIDTSSEEFIDKGNIRNLITLSDIANVDVFDLEEIKYCYNTQMFDNIYSSVRREGLLEKISEIGIESQPYRNISFSGYCSLLCVTKEYYESTLSKFNQFALGERYIHDNATFNYNLDNI